MIYKEEILKISKIPKKYCLSTQLLEILNVLDIEDFKKILNELKKICYSKRITNLAIPIKEYKFKNIDFREQIITITDIFEKTNINILVCK